MKIAFIIDALLCHINHVAVIRPGTTSAQFSLAPKIFCFLRFQCERLRRSHMRTLCCITLPCFVVINYFVMLLTLSPTSVLGFNCFAMIIGVNKLVCSIFVNPFTHNSVVVQLLCDGIGVNKLVCPIFVNPFTHYVRGTVRRPRSGEMNSW